MGRGAMQTTQKGLQTVSHNLQNLNTKGYTRQRVTQTTMPALFPNGINKPALPGQLGTGVKVEEVTRIRPAPRVATWTWTTVACSVSAPPPAYCYFLKTLNCIKHQTKMEYSLFFLFFLCVCVCVCVCLVWCAHMFLLAGFQSQRRTSPPWSTHVP